MLNKIKLDVLVGNSLLAGLAAVLLMAQTASADTSGLPPEATKHWTADNGNGTYSNPLFYGEFEDPDIIRVGDDYYLAGTTMHMNPGVEILHSKDLVNWTLVGYCTPRLDLGPAYRLEEGNIYGNGIWAPCIRYHNGMFYILSNVNGSGLHVFRSQTITGPWEHNVLPFRHDMSVLFDDELGKVFIISGAGAPYPIEELSPDLRSFNTNAPQRFLTGQMGEGHHLYKINGKYVDISAIPGGTVDQMVAVADSIDGPWRIERMVQGESLGVTAGAPSRAQADDPGLWLHQGGMCDTPSGEWWSVIMSDHGSAGRMVSLVPVTWDNGFPLIGLPGNLRKAPNTWIKPNTGFTQPPAPTYVPDDNFANGNMNPLWQWNHVPDDTKWSLTEKSDVLRLHSLPAPNFWSARNSLCQRPPGPESIMTVELDTTGLAAGDRAGLALLSAPYAGIGVVKTSGGTTLQLFQGAGSGHSGDPSSDTSVTGPANPPSRLWLRVHCNFDTDEAVFSWSTDGIQFTPLGNPFGMRFQLTTFQGVRPALYNFNTSGQAGGYADFDNYTVEEPRARGIEREIPVGKTITLASGADSSFLAADTGSNLLVNVAAGSAGAQGKNVQFQVIDLGKGRVALKAVNGRFVSVAQSGVTLKNLAGNAPGQAESFQWINLMRGDTALMSLVNHRYLATKPNQPGQATADATGPSPARKNGVCFKWQEVDPALAVLNGAVIGSSGSWGNLGNATTNAFDGNTNTFYDAANATGDWAGLDLGSGAAAIVTQVRYCPRAGWAGRMVGGQFQGSNVADFSSGVVTLFTVASTPLEGTMTVQAVTNPTSFRYLRYIGPANAFCDVAEVEFWGANGKPPAAPSALAAMPDNAQEDGVTATKVFNGNVPPVGHPWKRESYNPVLKRDAQGNPLFTADPAALVEGDTLYIYAGRDEAALGGWFNMNEWVCYSTKDMVDWKYEGVVLKATDFTWGAPGTAWACQVVKRHGKYFLYSTTGRPGGGYSVGVAVSDRPTGPFVDAIGGPLFDNAITTGGPEDSIEDIDPTVFVDDDGQAYLYWGNSTLHYALLNENMISLKDLNGDGKISEGADIFSRIKIKDHPMGFGEAPWLYKANGKYYLVDAMSMPQQVAYAMSDSPRGPWQYKGVILNENRRPDGSQGDFNSDTSHPAVIEFKGQWYVFYHNAAQPTGGQTRRSVCVEKMSYNADGTIARSFITSTGPLGGAVRIQSGRQADHYVTFSGFDVKLGTLPADDRAFRWDLTQGLADEATLGTVSMQSVTHPGYYLTVKGDAVALEKNDASVDFRRRATFKTIPVPSDEPSPPRAAGYHRKGPRPDASGRQPSNRSKLRGIDAVLNKKLTAFQSLADPSRYLRCSAVTGKLTAEIITSATNSADQSDATFKFISDADAY